MTGPLPHPRSPHDDTAPCHPGRASRWDQDFRRVHRMGLISSVYRAAEWRHRDIELVAHDLLQHPDAVAG